MMQNSDFSLKKGFILFGISFFNQAQAAFTSFQPCFKSKTSNFASSTTYLPANPTQPNTGDETAGRESGSAGINLGGFWFAASNTIYLLTVLMLFVILMLYSGSFQTIVLRTPLSPIEKQSHSLSTSSPLEP